VTSALAQSLEDMRRVDEGIYAAIAATPTPVLDRFMRRLSSAADNSRLSIVAAAAIAAVGGKSGRRAAAEGLTAVAATSAITNLAIKPVARRGRPDLGADVVPEARRLAMPSSRSFPSGHSASAFAFATGVGHTLPSAAWPLRALATVVAYSRVHTGVHFPGDTVAGALVGTVIAQATARALDGRRGRRKFIQSG